LHICWCEAGLVAVVIVVPEVFDCMSSRNFMITILALFAAGCIQAEHRRNVKPKTQENQNFESYLTELEKAATVLRVFQSVVAIPGVFEKVPISFTYSLKETENSIRYLSGPKIEKSNKDVKLTAAKMEFTSNDNNAVSTDVRKRDQLSLTAWYFHESDLTLPKMNKLFFSYKLNETPIEAVVLEKNDDGNNRINFEEMLSLFPAAKAGLEEPSFLSGFMSYNSTDSGLLDITGKDIVFKLTDSHIRLAFTFTINERNGSMVAGTISGKLVNPETDSVASEYKWDIARIAQNAVNFPFEIYIPDGLQL